MSYIVKSQLKYDVHHMKLLGDAYVSETETLQQLNKEYDNTGGNIFLNENDRMALMKDSKLLNKVRYNPRPDFRLIDFDGFMNDLYY